MQGRFAYHIMGNLDKFKKTEAQLIEADEKAKTEKVESTGRTVSLQRYSPSDDKAILSYIINNEEYSKVKGTQLWERMEELQVVKGRSFRSMQRRFQQGILRKIGSYDFLTKEQISLFRGKEEEEFTQEEDQAILSYVTNNGAYCQVDGEQIWRKMVRQKTVQGHTWESIRGRFLTYIMENIQSYNLTDEQISFFKKKKREKGKKYTIAEEMAILNYIVSSQMYSRVGAPTLWKKMEDQKVAEGRSSESMRVRFNDYIMKNLHCYGLTEEQISFFKEKKEVAAGQSKSKQKWSREEDEAILSYISNNQSYSKVGGPSMWMMMEEQNVVEGRSWRSMHSPD